jgi:hypothetical protein
VTGGRKVVELNELLFFIRAFRVIRGFFFVEPGKPGIFRNGVSNG